MGKVHLMISVVVLKKGKIFFHSAVGFRGRVPRHRLNLIIGALPQAPHRAHANYLPLGLEPAIYLLGGSLSSSLGPLSFTTQSLQRPGPGPWALPDRCASLGSGLVPWVLPGPWPWALPGPWASLGPRAPRSPRAPFGVEECRDGEGVLFIKWQIHLTGPT